MNKYRKLLMSLGLIACLLSSCQCSTDGCSLQTAGGVCDAEPQAFNQEEWRKYLYEGSNEERYAFKEKYPDVSANLWYNTRCIRESMICDLTQNVIPIGTPYEKVVALLGKGADREPWSVREQDLDLYDKYRNSNALGDKKRLVYYSGANIDGTNTLVILFENDSVYGFVRTVAR